MFLYNRKNKKVCNIKGNYSISDGLGGRGWEYWRVRDWFEEGGCKESSEMESGSGRDCWQSGVNPATLVYGD